LPTADAVIRSKSREGITLASTSAASIWTSPDCIDLSALMDSRMSFDMRLTKASAGSACAIAIVLARALAIAQRTVAAVRRVLRMFMNFMAMR